MTVSRSCKPTTSGANRPQQNMDDEQNYTLSVDGGDPSSGLQIKADSTLRDVRVNFPVPAEFTFGVPASREKSLLAKDYLPLTLLNSAEVPTATLKPRKLPGPTQAQFDDLKRMFDEQENELDEERVRREAVETQAAALHGQLRRAQAAMEPLLQKRRERSKSQEGALRNLAVTAESMRAELKTLRTAVKQLRAEGPGASLQEQLLWALKSTSAATSKRQEQNESDAAKLRELLGAERREKKALEDALEASKRSCLEKDEQLATLEGKLSSSQIELAQVKEQLPSDTPQAPQARSKSAFAEYLQLCQIKREAGLLLNAGRELYERPTSTVGRDAFLAAMNRLASTTGNLLPDVSTGALPPPQLPQPLQQQPAAAAPAPSAAAPEAAAPAQLSPERFYPRGQTRQAYKGTPAALVASFSGSNLSKIKPRVGTASAGNLPQVGRVAPR